MRNASRLTLKLTLGRVEELDKPLDGAMSAAPTRGQLPRRQRHRHRHHRQHRHQRQRRNSHHHRHIYQCQYSSQECQTLQNDLDQQHPIEDQEEPAEKRPKVNPIFLWALQREQRIIEVRCEDYDKRNRIKLTKTPHGWRSIPRTSSNVYSACCCSRSNFLPKESRKASSSSPSVTSTCVPCNISLKSASSSPCSFSESVCSSMKGHTKQEKEGRAKVGKSVETRSQGGQSSYNMSDEESDATRMSSCRTSRRSMSCDDDQHPDDDPVEFDEELEEEDEYDDHYDLVERRTENSRFLTCGKTFRMIDLEKAKKDQFLQPRVVLQPLSPDTIRLSNSSERAKLHNEIEMVVEERENNDNIANGDKFQIEADKCINGENTDDDIEEIEDKDDIEELDEENATVFEYEDRDSVDMMDDDELQERENEVMNTNDLPEGSERVFYTVKQTSDTVDAKISKTYIEDDLIEESADDHEKPENDVEPGEIVMSLSKNRVPDLKPINNSTTSIPAKLPLNYLQQSETSSKRLLPSPPCSVTCSEDASRPDTVKGTIPSALPGGNPEGNRRKREAPKLIEVKPTEWRRRESLKPAQQLRELIERSGVLIPDPLLVPRDRLPSLAASPGTEIPRLLVSRPELRLPQALSRPELLADPDLLVISLGHLQQVLDSVPEQKIHSEPRNKRGPSEDSQLIQPKIPSEGKRLACKPIGSLMPAPMDLSRHSSTPREQETILRMRNGVQKQESEVTSTARLPGDDSRLWHPLFGCRQKGEEKLPRGQLSIQPSDRLQQPQNYQQQQPQDSGQHRASWHRTTLAS